MIFSGIFYFSKNNGPGRQRLLLPSGGYVYVRIEETDLPVNKALDFATPYRDEEVMNTHDISKVS